jgi:hypothetical protein
MMKTTGTAIHDPPLPFSLLSHLFLRLTSSTLAPPNDYDLQTSLDALPFVLPARPLRSLSRAAAAAAAARRRLTLSSC